jgi:hypothetical protein
VKSWRTRGTLDWPDGHRVVSIRGVTAGSVGGGAVEVLGAVGSVDGDDPVFVEGESPASFVNQVVMS